ncbi:pantothenate kinase [Starmerella bacillaris]|uniref:pantothenate kinase n=1 Tax=Starmerella bacillaris TaxID=1247836 RepID=A0AAV5RN04_STABA|nr:pantothenate kinase [Starmerella bacillaris]
MENAHIENARAAHVDVQNRSLAIYLPSEKTRVNRIGIDIGGSLAKCVYFKDQALRFASVETEKLDSFLDILKPLVCDGCTKLFATGGGAFKYNEHVVNELKVASCSRIDEIEALIIGATFLMTQVPQEVFVWDNSVPERDPMVPIELPVGVADSYPYMLVNIGSGVGFIRVDGPDKFERIGGTALGGGTLWGLLSLLTPAKNFDEMLQMANEGNHHNLDMLVGDIYGSGYPRMGLSATTTASFFAKAFKQGGETQFAPSDISRSLLIAISYNIAQLAYLHAHYHNIERIYFAGSYIRGHSQTIETISNGIKYWSKGEKTAFFFRHEGYLGAVGAFLSHPSKSVSHS